MTLPPPVPDGPPADDCARLRSVVASSCDEAHRAESAHAGAAEHVRDLKRDLVAAEHVRVAAGEATDPGLRSAEKARAREIYEHARQIAKSDEEMAEATAVWARALDRANRTGRLAQRALSRAQAKVTGLETELRTAEHDDEISRIRAESAEAACLDARVRLAGCEEQAQAQAPVQVPAPVPAPLAEPAASEPRQSSEPPAAQMASAGQVAPAEQPVAEQPVAEQPVAEQVPPTEQPVAISQSGVGEPMVIESMVSGDRRALELAAIQLADHTGLPPGEAQLQLQELVDAILSSAAAEGFLLFDPDHAFWSALSIEESRDVVGALARLGFQFEPAEGWHAGRAPAPMDLSMALAYAGLDARNMRDLPGADALRELPRSIGVDARAFLAVQAPDLTLDHVVRALGRRSTQLEPLWNDWGQVRPILLGDRRSLGQLPG